MLKRKSDRIILESLILGKQGKASIFVILSQSANKSEQ